MMYLLDTHVISELRKAKSGKANANVVAWAKAIPTSQLYISAITVLELEMGVLDKERSDSAQGKALRHWLESSVLPAFTGRIVALDTDIARCCAALYIPDRRPERDALIAATGLVHGMTIATRNTSDFSMADIKCLNPWLIE